MPSYAVEKVLSAETKPRDDGSSWKKFMLVVAGKTVEFCDWSGKRSIEEAQIIEGEITQGKFGLELKPPKRAGGGGGTKDFKADPQKLRGENARSALHAAKDLVIHQVIQLNQLGEYTAKFADYIEKHAAGEG